MREGLGRGDGLSGHRKVWGAPEQRLLRADAGILGQEAGVVVGSSTLGMILKAEWMTQWKTGLGRQGVSAV